MTTSGQTEFSTNGSQIVTDAYLVCGGIDIEAAPSAAQYALALRMLNRMIKQWQTRGVMLSFFKDVTFTLTSGVGSYVVGTGQTPPNIATSRPMRVISANRKDSSGNETEMTIISREDYSRLSDKANTGIPTQLYYDRQATSGTIYVWPVPSDSTSTAIITIERQVEIFVDDGDTPDFPVETELALVYGLAGILCGPLTIPLQEAQIIKAEALNYFNQALMTDQETTGFFFQPDRRGRNMGYRR